jgi:hypothetical protein
VVDEHNVVIGAVSQDFVRLRSECETLESQFAPESPGAQRGVVNLNFAFIGHEKEHTRQW